MEAPGCAKLLQKWPKSLSSTVEVWSCFFFTMGAEQSRMRASATKAQPAISTTATPDPTASTEDDTCTNPSHPPESAASPTPETDVAEGPLPEKNVSPNPDVTHIVDSHVDVVPESQSLSAHRDLVQRLRGDSSAASEHEREVRCLMEAAGVVDTRYDAGQDEGRATDVSTGGDESDEDDESGTDSDTTSSSDDDTPVVPFRDEDDDDDLGAPPKTKNEMDQDDNIPLPPIAQVADVDLPLLQRIGVVHSVVDNVVLVEQQSQDTTPQSFDVLDCESLLSFDDGRVLGIVYETFGSVQAPMYTVRFRRAEDIDREHIYPGRTVFCLPSSSTFVLTKQLRTKGSDASNMWDEEVAEDEIEYSDDEAEASAKRRRKMRGGSLAPDAPDTDVDPATASLGPLGGRGFGRGSSSARRRGRGRGGARAAAYAPASGWPGAAPAPAAFGYGVPPPAATPHYNPSFAEQWIHPPPSMLYGVPMPHYSVPAYSPRNPSLSEGTGPPDLYEPYSPDVRPRPPGGAGGAHNFS